MSQAVSQAEFARLIGVGRSYVTTLKTAGRLVLDHEGKVLVEESKALIAKTSGAPERAAVVTKSFSDSKEEGEFYATGLKRLEYKQKEGSLIDLNESLDAVVSHYVTARIQFESIPDVLAPQLAAISSEEEIRAILAERIEIILSGMSSLFAKIAGERDAS